MEEVTPTSAKLWAEINPNGLSTSYRFEYITEAAYLANQEADREGFEGAVQVPPGQEGSISGSDPPPVVLQAKGLVPATTYRYRPVATNPAGPSVSGPEHALTTQERSTPFRLLDNRAWEMVSPVDKNGGAIAAPEALFGGGDTQAAAIAPAGATAALTYGSATSFGVPAGAPPASQYTSARTGAGWGTRNISTPLDSGAYGDQPDGVPYRLFSADLSRALLFGGLACRGGIEGCPAPNQPLPGTGAPAGYMAYYLRDSATGTLSSLLGAVDVGHATGVSPPKFEVAFAAASPDLSHIVLSSCAKLTADAAETPAGPERCDPNAPNLYEWSLAGLKSINGGTPGARIAAPNGAVSDDGSRVYWVQGENLLLRDGAETEQVDAAQGGGGTFQAATPDGSVAFFSKAGHLYRFTVAAKTAVDITPAGGVVGVLGASANGDRVYFQDAGGLELWHSGATTTVANGADATVASDYPPATGTSRVSPDGTHLAFLSKAELTGYDNVDPDSGQPVTEVYLYGPPAAGGPAAAPLCVSCNPTGERADGPSTIPGAHANGTAHAYKPRVLSSDGTRLFFGSEDKLVAQDTNSQPDVYEWELEGAGDCRRSPGCVSLISSGRGTEGASFLDATADGSDVFFITSESLVGADPPGSVDAYDARVNGGFAEALKPIPCIGDACQGLPSAPDDPTPGTLVPSPGNPPLRFFGPKPRKHHGHRRHKTHRHKHGKGKRQAGQKR